MYGFSWSSLSFGFSWKQCWIVTVTKIVVCSMSRDVSFACFMTCNTFVVCVIQVVLCDKPCVHRVKCSLRVALQEQCYGGPALFSPQLPTSFPGSFLYSDRLLGFFEDPSLTLEVTSLWKKLTVAKVQPIVPATPKKLQTRFAHLSTITDRWRNGMILYRNSTHK